MAKRKTWLLLLAKRVVTRKKRQFRINNWLSPGAKHSAVLEGEQPQVIEAKLCCRQEVTE